MPLTTPNFMTGLIGDEEVFPFRSRLFHMICGSSAIASALISIVHLLLGQNLIGYSIGLLSAALILALVISRSLKAYLLGIALFGICSTSTLYYLYLKTGGINGEALYGILVVYITLVLICTKNMRALLTTLFALVLVSLFCIESFAPQFIETIASQASNTDEILSFASIFVSLTFICYTGTTFLWEEYAVKNQIAATQYGEIEKQNAIISEKVAELEATNQQKDRLFSIIGHDLRNPLASIEGFLEAFDHGLDAEDQNAIKDQLIRLVQNSRGLLDNLVKWGKKNNQAKFETLNAKEIAMEAIGTLKPIAANKDISINVLMDEDDALVVADANMLEMVIRNLVSNAIKFTRSGGWIKIRAYTHSDYIALEVEDNGVGMDDKQRLKLFTPDKVISSGTNAERGVGLGLLLCKEFVEKMKGSISCSSIKDKGSKFKISLPIPSNTIAAANVK